MPGTPLATPGFCSYLLYPTKGITITHLARTIRRFAIEHDAIDSRVSAWTRAKDWRELHPAQPPN
jgi:hypothetical protein